MKLIYVAGPFRASNSWDIELNIRKAETLALSVWKKGAACICPHSSNRFYQGATEDYVWLNGFLEIVKRCDAILLVDGWETSEGTLEEIKLANTMNIPVFYSFQEFEKWFEMENK